MKDLLILKPENQNGKARVHEQLWSVLQSIRITSYILITENDVHSNSGIIVMVLLVRLPIIRERYSFGVDVRAKMRTLFC